MRTNSRGAFSTRDERVNTAEKLLIEITNGMPGVVCQFRWNRGENLVFTYLSEGTEPLLGIDRDDLMRDSSLLAKRVLPEFLPGILASFKIAAKAHSRWQYEYRATHADGRIRWLSIAATAHSETDGSIVWNGYGSDISTRKELECALIEARASSDLANRAKSKFLATMRHDIRTPMNSVLGMLELLGLTKLDAEQRTTVEIVNRSSKSLLRIIDDMLDSLGGPIGIESAPGLGTSESSTQPPAIADPSDQANLKLAADISQAALQLMIKSRRSPPSIAAAAAEGTLVLLVDDHPINCMVLLQQINAIGYAGEVAETGAAALQKWHSGKYALVLTDCNMPDMDGYELARHIRVAESRRGLTRIPIIACTANAMTAEAQLCRAAGMDDQLVKPVEIRALMTKLDQWLPLAAAKGSAIDRSKLAALSKGKVSVERELITMFRRLNDEDVAKLHLAVSAGDIPGAVHAAHRMSGASKMIGALRFAAVCERIEVAGRANDFDAVKAHMPALQQEVERVYVCLDSI